MKQSLSRAMAVAMTTLLIASAASAGEGNVFTKFMRWTGYGIGSGYHTCPCPKPARGWQSGPCVTGNCSPVVGSPCDYGCAKRPVRDVHHQQYAARNPVQISPVRSQPTAPADVAWRPITGARAARLATPDRADAPRLSRAADGDAPRYGRSPRNSSDRASFGN